MYVYVNIYMHINITLAYKKSNDLLPAFSTDNDASISLSLLLLLLLLPVVVVVVVSEKLLVILIFDFKLALFCNSDISLRLSVSCFIFSALVGLSGLPCSIVAEVEVHCICIIVSIR